MLKWVFGADTSPFRRSLNEMRGEVKAFSASAKSQLAGLFGAGAITAWASATLDAAGRIDDLSKRLDMSAESFQRLSYASKLSGGDMEVVGKALTILTKNLADAANGGDSFSAAATALNLDLGKLAQMSPEAKMIELARGYEASADKGAALAAIMKLLGKSGAEIVPMLADGPEALAQMMAEATVATNEQIATLAKIGDTIDALKSKSVAWLGSVIDGFKMWGAYAEWALNKTFGGSNADDMFEKRMDSITGAGSDAAGRNAAADKAMRDADELKKSMEERAKLSEDIAKLEEDARIKALSLAEKILDAEKRRAQFAAEAIFGGDETKALEARKSQLEVEKEIAGYRKEASDSANDMAAKRGKAADDLKTLSEKYSAAERSNQLAGMDDRAKRDFLKKERDDANAKARRAYDTGDTKGALEAGIQSQELTGQIDDLTRSLNSDLQRKLEDSKKAVPTLATSSLADIGGGGGARLMIDDLQRKSVDYLAQIAANTAGGAEGSKPPDPI